MASRDAINIAYHVLLQCILGAELGTLGKVSSKKCVDKILEAEVCSAVITVICDCCYQSYTDAVALICLHTKSEPFICILAARTIPEIDSVS